MSAEDERKELLCFAAVYTRGPRWDELTHAREKLRKAHIEYQHGHFVAGRMLLGGPFTDREFGMALFRTATKAETMKIVSEDPAVGAGIYNVEVCTWKVAHNAFAAD
jgi:uncharacterized protein YciI